MAGITANAGIDLGIPDGHQGAGPGLLVVVLEDHHEDRLEEDTQALAELIGDLGALDVYVLPDNAGTRLIQAREQAFWLSKANGADDIVDVVVPRASIPAYLDAVGELATATSSLVVGCGHAGDGNVHLSVWQADADVRHRLVFDIISAGCRWAGPSPVSTGSANSSAPIWPSWRIPPSSISCAASSRPSTPEILNPGTIFERRRGRTAR